MVRDEDWSSYLCRVNGHVSSVYTDLAVAEFAPRTDMPRLYWLWIRLRSPDARGLSTDAEFDDLCRFEDDLRALLSPRGDLWYVGRITGQKRREFYLYGVDDVDLKSVLAPLLTAHAEYQYQLGSQGDAAWTQYLELLYPGEHGLEQINKRRQCS